MAETEDIIFQTIRISVAKERFFQSSIRVKAAGDKDFQIFFNFVKYEIVFFTSNTMNI